MPLLDDSVQHDDDDDDDGDDNDDEHGYARRCDWILGTHAIARWLKSASWCWSWWWWSWQCFMSPCLDDDDEQVDDRRCDWILRTHCSMLDDNDDVDLDNDDNLCSFLQWRQWWWTRRCQEVRLNVDLDDADPDDDNLWQVWALARLNVWKSCHCQSTPSMHDLQFEVGTLLVYSMVGISWANSKKWDDL